MNHEIKPVATFGDIVQVAGYGTHLFAVDAYTYEYHHEPDETYTEVIYDLTCVYGNSGYIIGEQEDVTLACREAKADAFLQAYKPAPTAEDEPTLLRSIYFAIGNGGEVEMLTKQPKATKKPTKQAKIDTLLDELNDVRTLMATIGDSDGGYQRKIDEINSKLAEVLG